MQPPASESDLVFGQLVVEQGLSTREQVDECLRLQSDLVSKGVHPVPRLGELLLRKGSLSNSQYEATLRAGGSGSAGRAEAGAAPRLPADAAQAALDPANVLGKYVRVARLGAGGMGEVWRGWDRDLGRWVALKFLKGQDPDELARFRREAQTAAKLTHPNIAAIYEVGDHDGRPFIAMQLVEGQTLATVPRDDVRRLVTLVRDAALAVHFAHGRGVIHRDLKPANLMAEGISRDDGRPGGARVYVMDFGLAKQASADVSLSVSGNILGTPAYMPPEQARGRLQEITARSDVYSLGATLYELLADRPPFRGESVFELLQRVIGEEPRPLRKINPGIDRDLEVIVAKCLEKDPVRRYATMEELAEDLRRYLDGEPILARPASWTYRVRKRVVKHAALSIAIAAAALIAVAGGILLTLGAFQRAAERRGAELCQRSMDRLKEAKALWRIRLSERPQWEALFEQALEQARAAISRYPKMAWAHYTLGEILQAQGRWAEAIEAFDRALALDPTLAEAWTRRGLTCLQLYEETVQVQTIQQMAGGSSTEERRTQAEPHKKEAVESLRKFSELRGVKEESSVEVRYARAAFDFAERRFEEAERACDALLRESRTDERVWLLKAQVQSNLKRPAESVQTLDQLIRDVMPHYYQAFLVRALAKSVLQDWPGAEADCLEAIRHRPASGPAYQILGAALSRQGRFPDAAKAFDRAMEIEPPNALTLASRGASRLRAGDREGAIADLSRAIKLDPESTLVRINLAALKADQGDWKGALEFSEAALKRSPKSSIAHSTRAGARMNLGDLAGAREDCDRAVELDPKNAYGYINRAAIRVKLGDPAGAQADATRGIELDPLSPHAYSNRAAVRLTQLDPRNALEDALRAAELDPRNAMIQSTLGACKTALGDHQGAVEALDRAIAINPGLAMAFATRAAAKWNLGDSKGTLEDSTRAIELDPKLSLAYSTRATVWIRTRDTAKASEDLNRAIAADGKNVFAFINRSTLKSQAGDWKGCAEDAAKAIELNPREPMGFINRGIARGELKAYKGALEDFSRALELDPRSAATYRARGNVKRELGDLKGALEDGTTSLRLDPSAAAGYVSRGLTKQRLQDWAGAIQDHSKAIEIEPTDPEHRRDRADARWMSGDAKGAGEDWSRVIEMDPKDTQSYINRAGARARLGDRPGAVADYGRAIELDPRNVIAYAYRGRTKLRLLDWKGVVEDTTRAIELDPKMALPYSDRAMAKANLEDWAGALEDASKAVELDPKDVFALATRGRAKAGLKDFDGALQDCARAFEMDPRAPRVIAARGQVHARRGDWKAAAADLKKAVEIDADLGREYGPLLRECEAKGAAPSRP